MTNKSLYLINYTLVSGDTHDYNQQAYVYAYSSLQAIQVFKHSKQMHHRQAGRLRDIKTTQVITPDSTNKHQQLSFI